jgi:hypothetical protein
MREDLFPSVRVRATFFCEYSHESVLCEYFFQTGFGSKKFISKGLKPTKSAHFQYGFGSFLPHGLPLNLFSAQARPWTVTSDCDCDCDCDCDVPVGLHCNLHTLGSRKALARTPADCAASCAYIVPQ